MQGRAALEMQKIVELNLSESSQATSVFLENFKIETKAKQMSQDCFSSSATTEIVSPSQVLDGLYKDN